MEKNLVLPLYSESKYSQKICQRIDNNIFFIGKWIKLSLKSYKKIILMQNKMALSGIKMNQVKNAEQVIKIITFKTDIIKR